MRPINRQYLPEVDGLRAIAVLSVLIFHLDFGLFTGGFVGVDIFFVISGFLITKNIVNDYSTGNFSFLRFYYRRFRRLFPALLFTILVCLVFSILVLTPEHLARFSKSLIFAVLSISNIYFYGESGYFDTSAFFKPLLHFWSLAVEEQFYLVWPAIIALLLKLRSNVSIIIGLAFFGISSVVASEYLLPKDPDAVFYLTPFRIVEFSIGALCLWVPSNNLKNRYYEIGLIAGLSLILFSIISFNDKTIFPGIRSLLPCVGAALVILSKNALFSGVLLRTKPIVRIGLISYSLYLIHWPLFIFYSYWKIGEVTILEKILLIIVAFIFAELMYKYIEQVFKYRPVKKDRPFPVRFFALSALLTIIAVIPAIHAKTHNGWKWRVIDSGSFDFDVSEFRCRNHIKNPGHEYTCNIGSESQEVSKALLVGDSHAGQFSAGLDYLGKRHDIRVEMWIHPGCPPLWNTYKIYGTNNPSKQETCKKLVPKWEEAMISGRYDYIIIAARWMYLYEPVDYGDKKIRRDILVDRHNPLIDVNNSRKLWVYPGFAKELRC